MDAATLRHIEELVAAMPPLTEQQRNDISAIIRPAWQAMQASATKPATRRQRKAA